MARSTVNRSPASWLRRIGGGARDLLFPPQCVACSRELKPENASGYFCSGCMSKLPLVDWPTCQKCAARVPELPGSIETCMRCQTANHRFDRSFTLGSYESLQRDLIIQMKNDRSEILAAAFGQLILDRYGDRLGALALDAIVPVPMSTRRRLLQGTNPPAAIAEVLSRSLRTKCFSRLLTKSHNASPQRGLSQAGRFRNVRGQIGVRAGYHLEAPHVLLVDDTMTTGATCGEVAKVLKRRGAAQVTVMVVGRTPNT